MAHAGDIEALNAARVALVKSLPRHLSVFEKKQIRDFLDGVINLREDEVASDFDLFQALIDDENTPWRNYYRLLPEVKGIFDSRITAKTYQGDIESFREWYDFVGSEFERESEPWEVQEAFDGWAVFGYGDDWDFEILNFADAVEAYWGEETKSSYLKEALAQTLQILCLSVFTPEVATPVLSRWQVFSNNFKELKYWPIKMEALHLKNIPPDHIFN